MKKYILLSGSVLMSLHAFTQENTGTIKNGTIKLSELVISATRWKQDLKDLPSKIITISPKDIALQQPQTTAVLLGNTGKVFIQKSQLGGAL